MALTRLGGANAISGTIPQGNIANASLGAVTALPAAIPTGKVLQSVNTYVSSGDKTTTSNTFSDLSGVSLSITPSATSSKILLMVNTNMYNTTSGSYWKLRWERDIGGTSTTFGSGSYGLSHARTAVDNDFFGGVGMTYLDSPNTTSAITYTVQIAADGGTASFGVNNMPSSIFAYEIGA